MAKKKMSNKDYHFGIRCYSNDLAAVHALRGLSQYAESSSKKFYAWSGTGEKEWREHGNHVTFHFSSPSFRAEFVKQATRLLPSGSWQDVGQRDDEIAPEKPVKRRRSRMA